MPDRILNDEQCQCLDQVAQSIAHTRDLIARCKDCGLDMSRYDQELEAQAQITDGFRRNFGTYAKPIPFPSG